MLEFNPTTLADPADYAPQIPAPNDLPRTEVIIAGVPESELLAHAQQTPDQEAFAIIFEHHRLRVAQKVQWTPHQEDVVQDTYIRGWKGLERFRNEGAGLYPWLGKIAYNRAVELWRRDQRIAMRSTDPLDTDSALYAMPDPEPSIDRALARVVRHLDPEAMTRMLKIIEDQVGLDAARYFQVIGVDGRKPRDYAEVAGIAPQTAHTRAMRIRQKLGTFPTRDIIFSALETEGIL